MNNLVKNRRIHRFEDKCVVVDIHNHTFTDITGHTYEVYGYFYSDEDNKDISSLIFDTYVYYPIVYCSGKLSIVCQDFCVKAGIFQTEDELLLYMACKGKNLLSNYVNLQ